MKPPKEFQFIIELGKTLHISGVPSYKIQDYLKEVAHKKNIEGTFMDLPTWINYAFYKNGLEIYHYIEGIPPGELNLGSLSKSVEITNQVVDNKIEIKKAEQALKDLQKKPPSVPLWLEIFAYGLSAFSFSVIVGSNWISSIVSFFMGAIVGILTILARKSKYLTSTLESFSAFVATVLVGLILHFFDTLQISITILGAIIVFIPGLAITTAIEELSSKSLVSGSAKLFDAILILFKLFFGVTLGLTLLPIITDINLSHPVGASDIPWWMSYLAMPLFSYGLLVVFHVRKKDAWGALLVGTGSFLIVYVLSFLGILLSTFLGTIAVVVMSKLLNKYTRTPETVFSTLGIIALVPGSKAFLGLSSMFIYTDAQIHQNLGEQVLFILMGIIGGLFFAGSFRQK